jgi:hypothetical protein
VICALRKLRFSGPEIAEVLGRPASTVSAVLKREGMGRLGRLGLQPACRYEKARPGELIHIDIKKLGRIQGGAGKRVTGTRRHHSPTFTDKHHKRRRTVGWEFVHIAIDDATRLAYAEVLGDEKAATAISFLRRATRFFDSYGITVQALLTDNGSAYKARVHALACQSWASATCAPAPGAPRPTAKQNASSAPCWSAGPTAPSTPAPPSAPPPLTAGYTTTTITDHTDRSAARPRSHD